MNNVVDNLRQYYKSEAKKPLPPLAEIGRSRGRSWGCSKRAIASPSREVLVTSVWSTSSCLRLSVLEEEKQMLLSAKRGSSTHATSHDVSMCISPELLQLLKRYVLSFRLWTLSMSSIGFLYIQIRIQHIWHHSHIHVHNGSISTVTIFLHQLRGPFD